MEGTSLGLHDDALHATGPDLLCNTTVRAEYIYIHTYTGRFAPRAAYAARYACSGRKNSVKWTEKGPCLIVSANWRLENECQEPRRHAPGKQPTDATLMSTPRMIYVPGILYLRCICVCLEACDYTELLSLG